MEPTGKRGINANNSEVAGFPDYIRHTFAVSPLKDEGDAKYLCVCIRCKWSFKVNRESGAVLALDESGEALDGYEAAHRAETFAEGPCPAFVRFPEYEEAVSQSMHPGFLAKLNPILHLFGLSA
jgi:hypothetical protein